MDHLIPIPVLIDLSTLPRAEHEAVRHMTDSLRALDDYINHYADALLLLERAQDAQITGWMHVALRDATMSAWHFGRILQKGFDTKRCISFGKSFHVKERLSSARSIYNMAFRDAADARDAVAHSADKRATASSLAANSFTGTISIPGAMAGAATNAILEGNTITDASGETRLFSTHKSAHRETRVVYAALSRAGLAALTASRNAAVTEFVEIGSILDRKARQSRSA